MPPRPRKPFRPQGQSGFKPKKTAPSEDKGWDPVAAWYDKLVGEAGSDYHRHVILPATLKWLDLQGGESILDVCCGQGVLVKPLLEGKIGRYLGVDASPRLIKAAKSRHGSDKRVSFVTADACQPGEWADGTYDAATCLMAVHDVPEPVGMFQNISDGLKPGGKVVLVFMHPCFRIPRQSHWGWDADQKIQYRRLDSYGSAREIQIATHPGKGTGEETIFYHRPLAQLLSAIGEDGLAVVGCEELYSHRRSQGGGAFSKAEHRAVEEFPMFMALVAIKRS
ncbi:class I SAM-dependent methyltransferase [Luteolibacter pohnpeiensis]|uniref:Class I SAM-dependent methyltransferase n=1 Tax=Luteolibacter pohnpeiensis TaxID=454153 RepID=A0A934VWA3_9BACT|nr:class I SAM-dependent methyltransferase [Luteolibacter pohnpeiensis]MBK1882608.1 class I SAM-dependent methyltransferase [Luteolibacter pohnpeiensis]